MRQTRRTVEKRKVFEATSEEDTCSGFEENVISSRIKAMVRSGQSKTELNISTKQKRFL